MPTTVQRRPTTGVAVVYIGDTFDAPWTPIGWWDGFGWVNVGVGEGRASVPVPTAPSVSVASVDLPGGPLAGVAVSAETDYICVDDRVGPYLLTDADLPASPLGFGYTAVAVNADWNIQPRAVAAVGRDADIYQSVGESLVSDVPGVDPGRGDVVQVLRVDLDGNGVEEVLFAFERRSDTTGIGAPGDFSLVIARLPRPDGSIQDQVLFEHIVPESFDFPQPGRASIAAVADLNGDGVMEVALRSEFWESAGITVLSFEEGGLEAVLSGGCGV